MYDTLSQSLISDPGGGMTLPRIPLTPQNVKASMLLLITTYRVATGISTIIHYEDGK